VGLKGAAVSAKHDDASTGLSERSERRKRAASRASRDGGGFLALSSSHCGGKTTVSGFDSLRLHVRRFTKREPNTLLEADQVGLDERVDAVVGDDHPVS